MKERCAVVAVPSVCHAPFWQAALDAFGPSAPRVLAPGMPDAMLKGLARVNNDACYAAVMAVGRVLAFESETGGRAAGVVALAPCVRCRGDDMPGILSCALAEGDGASSVVMRLSDVLACGDVGDDAQRLLADATMLGDVVLQAETYLAAHACAQGARAQELLHDVRSRVADALARGVRLDVPAVARAVDRAVAQLAPRCAGVPAVGVVGSVTAVFDKDVNAGLLGRIAEEGCEAVVPYLGPLLSHSLAEQGISCAFSRRLEELSGAVGGGDALRPCPTLSDLHAAARRCGLDDCLVRGAGPTVLGGMCLLHSQGVRAVAYASVFGCAAGHVVGQGVLNLARRRLEGLNVAVLEYDPGTSAVNQLNRLRLLTSMAKQAFGANGRGGGAKVVNDSAS